MEPRETQYTCSGYVGSLRCLVQLPDDIRLAIVLRLWDFPGLRLTERDVQRGLRHFEGGKEWNFRMSAVDLIRHMPATMSIELITVSEGSPDTLLASSSIQIGDCISDNINETNLLSAINDEILLYDLMGYKFAIVGVDVRLSRQGLAPPQPVPLIPKYITPSQPIYQKQLSQINISSQEAVSLPNHSTNTIVDDIPSFSFFEFPQGVTLDSFLRSEYSSVQPNEFKVNNIIVPKLRKKKKKKRRIKHQNDVTNIEMKAVTADDVVGLKNATITLEKILKLKNVDSSEMTKSIQTVISKIETTAKNNNIENDVSGHSELKKQSSIIRQSSSPKQQLRVNIAAASPVHSEASSATIAKIATPGSAGSDTVTSATPKSSTTSNSPTASDFAIVKKTHDSIVKIFKTLRAGFAQWDIDNNQRLTKQEFINGMSNLKIGKAGRVSDHQLKYLIKHHCRCESVLKIWHSDVSCVTVKTSDTKNNIRTFGYEILGSNGDRARITGENLTGSTRDWYSSKVPYRLFELIDTDSSGSISSSEFIGMLQAHDADRTSIQQTAMRRSAVRKSVDIETTSEQIKSLEEKVYTSNSSLSKALLVSQVNELLLTQHGSIRGAFADLDVDRQRTLSFDEFSRGVSSFPIRPETVRALFDTLDVNKNNELEFSEFYLLINSLGKKVMIKPVEDAKAAFSNPSLPSMVKWSVSLSKRCGSEGIILEKVGNAVRIEFLKEVDWAGPSKSWWPFAAVTLLKK